MNPTNFDWLNQLSTNGENDNGNLLGNLGLDTSDMTANDTGGEQDLVKYLFDTAQFSASLDSSASQTASHSTNSSGNSSSGGSSTDGDSPKSTASSTMNSNNIPAVAFDNTWLTSVDPQSSFTIIQTKVAPSSSALKTTKKPSSSTSSRRIRAKKKREPIFVTESPQNAYKKKNKKPSATSMTSPPNLPSIDENEQQQHHHHDSSSPSSHYDDDTIDMNDSLEMQHLTSKERRQLRNKISARNFRVRRKEYITELENKVDEQEDEIEKLKQDNKQLNKLNEQLVQEVMQLRMRQQQQSPPPESQAQPLQVQQQQHYQYQQQQPLTVSPPTSDTNSPPDFVESLLDFNLFNNNTYLSHSLMPDFDLSRVLNDKLANPPSTINLEQHRELMTMYPLLAPALASIVIRHTFTLHYISYLTDYNATRPKNEVLDIMHPDDWATALSTGFGKNNLGDDGLNIGNDSGNKLLSTHLVEQHSATPSNDGDSDNEEAWMKDLERKMIRNHYPYYAFMRMRGFSHEQIMQRCKICMEQKIESERQRRRKAATSCSRSQTFHGFTSVAASLLRNPSRSPMIAGVMQSSKACNLTPKNSKNKATLMMTAPLRAALRIGAGKS
ncbi:hypothetical protein BCR42DRAFT_423668 [Absidia repens]|uniref:BZIP domain-containing protein n=1 Tax=Absidia repens TaxID=90262 RepID=A0A1X2I562_9FUNG|nr:hypothetical protein BCR42DRAFT_423668 [Absidia repens]